MSKDKESPRRMGRDAAGNMVPQVQVRAFWVDEPTHEANAKLAAANQLSGMPDWLRQLMRDAADNNGEGAK